MLLDLKYFFIDRRENGDWCELLFLQTAQKSAHV